MRGHVRKSLIDTQRSESGSSAVRLADPGSGGTAIRGRYVRKAVSAIRRLADIICTLTEWITFVLLLLSTTIAFGGIVARFIFNSSFPWEEEAGAYLLVAITTLGMAIGIRERGHI